MGKSSYCQPQPSLATSWPVRRKPLRDRVCGDDHNSVNRDCCRKFRWGFVGDVEREQQFAVAQQVLRNGEFFELTNVFAIQRRRDAFAVDVEQIVTTLPSGRWGDF